MAPLTWRNVDAPSFSGPNEMWKLAATLMNQGFDSAHRGINDFRDITTEEQSAAMMQRVMAAGNDPAAIQAAAASGNPAYLSPEALKFANNQQGVLLERQATGLQNDIRSQSIRANDYNFGRTVLDNQRADANYDLLPEANAAFANLRNGIANGTLTGDAKAAAEAEFVTKYGRALGINSAADMGSFISNNQTAFTTQQTQNIAAIQNDETLTGLVRGKDAKGIAANILSRYPDYATAQRALQSWGDIDPALKVDALKALETLAPAAVPKTPAQIEAEKNAQFRGVTPAGAQPLPGSYQEFQRGTSSPLVGLIDSHEGGGDYNTLYGHVNRRGPFAGVNVSNMSVGEVLQFSSRSGPYGAYQQQQGIAAAPVGRFQVINSTLRNAVQELGLDPSTPFNADTQNLIFNHLADKRLARGGTMAEKMSQMRQEWDGFRNVSDSALSAAITAYEGGDRGAFAGVTGQQPGPTVERARQMYQPQYQQMLDAVANNGSYTASIDPSRVQVQNPDGTVSTEKSITFKDGDNWVNIPSLVQGKQLTEDEAIAQFRDGLNPATGVYPTQRAAEDAAEARSAEIGRMLDQAANPARAQEQAQAETNQALNESLTPSLAQTTTNTKSATSTVATATQAEDNFPKVDKNASAYVQATQRDNRMKAINNAIADMTSSTGGGFGSGVSDWAAGTWDYFMATPEEGAANATARRANNDAGDFFAANADYFRQNPGEIAVAKRDPVAYVNNFGKTASQKEYLKSQPVDNSPGAQIGRMAGKAKDKTNTAEAKPANVTSPSQATASSVDMALSTALNTSAIDTANNQSLGLINAIQSMENSNELPAETANRLTDKDKGPLKAYSHRAVSKAIEDIMTATGANAAVAGQILQMNGVARYNTGWVPGTDEGWGSGYEINTDRAQEIWNTYVNRNKPGVEGANEGVARLITDDLTQAQRAELSTLQTQYKEREASIKALIADPTTTDADRALLRQELQNLYSFMQGKVNGMLAGGRLTTNLAPRTGQ